MKQDASSPVFFSALVFAAAVASPVAVTPAAFAQERRILDLDELRSRAPAPQTVSEPDAVESGSGPVAQALPGPRLSRYARAVLTKAVSKAGSALRSAWSALVPGGRTELVRAPAATSAATRNGASSAPANRKELAAAPPPAPVVPGTPAAVCQAALARAARDRDGYAYRNAPQSPFANLSGNEVPGETRPGWLKNKFKCNQFVGDVLLEAGMMMPTNRMSDGSEHYAGAEQMVRRPAEFGRITSLADVRPGDVIVIDYPGTGEASAHTEVVTAIDLASGFLKTTGARYDGASEKESPYWLKGRYFAKGEYWLQGGNKLYFLRPQQKP